MFCRIPNLIHWRRGGVLPEYQQDVDQRHVFPTFLPAEFLLTPAPALIVTPHDTVNDITHWLVVEEKILAAALASTSQRRLLPFTVKLIPPMIRFSLFGETSSRIYLQGLKIQAFPSDEPRPQLPHVAFMFSSLRPTK